MALQRKGGKEVLLERAIPSGLPGGKETKGEVSSNQGRGTR